MTIAFQNFITNSMIKLVKNGRAILGGICCTLALSSCLEKPAEPVSKVDKLFRPVQFTATTNGATVSFNWVPIKGASYLLEVSKDTLRFQNELKTVSIDNSTSHTLGDLWSSTFYSARIKAISKEGGVLDSEFQTVTFITGIENIFYAVDNAGITGESVKLAWDVNKNVTDIRIYTGDQLQSTRTLTDSEKTDGFAVIGNLKPKTSYVFKIVKGEMVRGTVSVATKEGV